MMEQIIQIIPATDWYAVYRDDVSYHPDEKIDYVVPVVCWALVEDESGERRVDAIDDGTTSFDGEFVSQVSGFKRYLYSKSTYRSGEELDSK